jgi:hypothetical protein
MYFHYGNSKLKKDTSFIEESLIEEKEGDQFFGDRVTTGTDLGSDIKQGIRGVVGAPIKGAVAGIKTAATFFGDTRQFGLNLRKTMSDILNDPNDPTGKLILTEILKTIESDSGASKFKDLFKELVSYKKSSEINVAEQPKTNKKDEDEDLFGEDVDLFGDLFEEAETDIETPPAEEPKSEQINYDDIPEDYKLDVLRVVLKNIVGDPGFLSLKSVTSGKWLNNLQSRLYGDTSNESKINYNELYNKSKKKYDDPFSPQALRVLTENLKSVINPASRYSQYIEEIVNDESKTISPEDVTAVTTEVSNMKKGLKGLQEFLATNYKSKFPDEVFTKLNSGITEYLSKLDKFTISENTNKETIKPKYYTISNSPKKFQANVPANISQLLSNLIDKGVLAQFYNLKNNQFTTFFTKNNIWDGFNDKLQKDAKTGKVIPKMEAGDNPTDATFYPSQGTFKLPNYLDNNVVVDQKDYDNYQQYFNMQQNTVDVLRQSYLRKYKTSILNNKAIDKAEFTKEALDLAVKVNDYILKIRNINTPISKMFERYLQELAKVLNSKNTSIGGFVKLNQLALIGETLMYELVRSMKSTTDQQNFDKVQKVYADYEKLLEQEIDDDMNAMDALAEKNAEVKKEQDAIDMDSKDYSHIGAGTIPPGKTEVIQAKPLTPK